MQEIRSILNAYDQALLLGKRCALATVVHVDGSSYRRPGARMLITENGQLTGSISGGCLEGDALQKALHVIASGNKMLVTYDTSEEDDAQFGMGLGCNGIIQVLIEPLHSNEGERLITLLRAAVAERKKAALVTLFSLENRKAPQQGTCLLLKENGEEKGEKNAHLLAEAARVINIQKSSFKQYDDGRHPLIAFTEFIMPAVRLVIAGAGNDVFPLVQIADTMGWETWVADGRPMYAKKERFAAPSCQVMLAGPEEVLRAISIDERTVFVLMTHNYNYDLTLMRALLPHHPVYIGVLGPKKKLSMMIADLESAGVHLSEQQRSSIYGPVGLNLGAETPEEVALSVAAEIKAVLADTIPASLRNTDGVIHHRGDLAIELVRIDMGDRLVS